MLVRFAIIGMAAFGTIVGTREGIFRTGLPIIRVVHSSPNDQARYRISNGLLLQEEGFRGNERKAYRGAVCIFEGRLVIRRSRTAGNGGVAIRPSTSQEVVLRRGLKLVLSDKHTTPGGSLPAAFHRAGTM